MGEKISTLLSDVSIEGDIVEKDKIIIDVLFELLPYFDAVVGLLEGDCGLVGAAGAQVRLG